MDTTIDQPMIDQPIEFKSSWLDENGFLTGLLTDLQGPQRDELIPPEGYNFVGIYPAKGPRGGVRYQIFRITSLGRIQQQMNRTCRATISFDSIEMNDTLNRRDEMWHQCRDDNGTIIWACFNKWTFSQIHLPYGYVPHTTMSIYGAISNMLKAAWMTNTGRDNYSIASLQKSMRESNAGVSVRLTVDSSEKTQLLTKWQLIVHQTPLSYNADEFLMAPMSPAMPWLVELYRRIKNADPGELMHSDIIDIIKDIKQHQSLLIQNQW